MTDSTVTPIRRGQHAYTDTAALNDIHALLTSSDLGAGTLADIAAIVARTSQALIPVRDIETSSTETILGWPVACVDAGETTVFVRQATAGTGLVVEICTRTEAEQMSSRIEHTTNPGPRHRDTHPGAHHGRRHHNRNPAHHLRQLGTRVLSASTYYVDGAGQLCTTTCTTPMSAELTGIEPPF